MVISYLYPNFEVTEYFWQAKCRLCYIELSESWTGKGQDWQTAGAVSLTAEMWTKVKKDQIQNWAATDKIKCLDSAAIMMASARMQHTRHTICIAHSINWIVKFPLTAQDYEAIEETTPSIKQRWSCQKRKDQLFSVWNHKVWWHSGFKSFGFLRSSKAKDTVKHLEAECAAEMRSPEPTPSAVIHQH